MKPNLSTVDRIIRILLAITFGILFYLGIISGTLAVVLLTFGGILVITSFLRFCPIYRVFGISTCKVQSN